MTFVMDAGYIFALPFFSATTRPASASTRIAKFAFTSGFSVIAVRRKPWVALMASVPCTICAPVLSAAAVSVVVVTSAPAFWTSALATAASGPSSVISTKLLLSASAVVDRLVALRVAIRSPATIRFL